ncbi:hypothetical protein DFJ74DRAFT_477566 [Hyaloraphidium curvatum]|nr:hypothetical protein DFJ74DRAFT_477566 [Hyaloraphidium curvatum]
MAGLPPMLGATLIATRIPAVTGPPRTTATLEPDAPTLDSGTATNTAAGTRTVDGEGSSAALSRTESATAPGPATTTTRRTRTNPGASGTQGPEQTAQPSQTEQVSGTGAPGAQCTAWVCPTDCDDWECIASSTVDAASSRRRKRQIVQSGDQTYDCGAFTSCIENRCAAGEKFSYNLALFWRDTCGNDLDDSRIRDYPRPLPPPPSSSASLSSSRSRTAANTRLSFVSSRSATRTTSRANALTRFTPTTTASIGLIPVPTDSVLGSSTTSSSAIVIVAVVIGLVVALGAAAFAAYWFFFRGHARKGAKVAPEPGPDGGKGGKGEMVKVSAYPAGVIASASWSGYDESTEPTETGSDGSYDDEDSYEDDDETGTYDEPPARSYQAPVRVERPLPQDPGPGYYSVPAGRLPEPPQQVPPPARLRASSYGSYPVPAVSGQTQRYSVAGYASFARPGQVPDFNREVDAWRERRRAAEERHAREEWLRAEGEAAGERMRERERKRMSLPAGFGEGSGWQRGAGMSAAPSVSELPAYAAQGLQAPAAARKPAGWMPTSPVSPSLISAYAPAAAPEPATRSRPTTWFGQPPTPAWLGVPAPSPAPITSPFRRGASPPRGPPSIVSDYAVPAPPPSDLVSDYGDEILVERFRGSPPPPALVGGSARMPALAEVPTPLSPGIVDMYGSGVHVSVVPLPGSVASAEGGLPGYPSPAGESEVVGDYAGA